MDHTCVIRSHVLLYKHFVKDVVVQIMPTLVYVSVILIFFFTHIRVMALIIWFKLIGFDTESFPRVSIFLDRNFGYKFPGLTWEIHHKDSQDQNISHLKHHGDNLKH